MLRAICEEALIFPLSHYGAPVVDDTGYPFPNWFANGPNSQWIGSADASPGQYTYNTTFDLTGFDLETVAIAGMWSTDNDGVDILINGNSLGYTTPYTAFTAFHGISIDSGLVNGINTLTFIMNNESASTGLRVEWVTTASVDPPPTISFDAASYTVNEDAGTATINAVLSGPSGKTISAAYDTLSGSALAGADFTRVFGTLVFAPGVTSLPIVIPILADVLAEGDEFFTATLSAPVNVTLGSPATAAVTILDKGAPLHAAGSVLVGLEQRAVNGWVASFTDDDPGAAAADFEATILWGDGQSSLGLVTANAGGFDVAASHTYVRRGSYPVVVQIEKTTNNAVTVAGSYAAILPLDDHAAIQTVVSTSLSSGGSFTTYVMTEAPGAYEVDLEGVYGYAYTVSLADGLYETVNTTYTGTYNFSLHAEGQNLTSAFTIDIYNLSESGSVGIDRDVDGKDLEGSYARTVDGTQTVLYRNKSGSDTSGSFALASSLSTSLNIAEAGVYGGHTYVRTESPTTNTTLGESGNYLTGAYTEARVDTTPSTPWLETGNVYSDTYTQNGSHNDSLSVTESGNLFTAAYTVAGNANTTPTVSENFTNGVATGTSNVTGASIAVTINKTGNWNTGLYSWDPVVTSNHGSNTVSITDQTATGSQTSTGNSSTIVNQTGNALVGSYILHQVSSGSGSGSGTGTNQTASGGGNSGGGGSSTLDQAGNVLTGAYALSLVASGSGGGSGNGSDQTASGNGSVSSSGTTTLDRSGNTKTGAYSLEGTATGGGSSSGGGSDLTASGSGSASLSSSLSVFDETGNTLSGAYTFHQETVASNATVSGNGSNQTASGGSSLTAPAITVTIDEEGNRISGSYALSEETVTPFFSGTFNDTNQTVNASGTITGSSNVTLNQVGDLTSGHFELIETSEQTITTTVTTGQDARGTFTSLETVATVSTKEMMGNNITGNYSLTVTNDPATTSLLKNGGDGATTYFQTVNSTPTYMLEEEGNFVTGAYFRTESSATVSSLTESGAYLGTPFAITRPVQNR